MIKSTAVQTLGEVRALLEDLSKEEQEENKKVVETTAYLKSFVKSKPEKIKALKKALNELNLVKLNSRFISKIIDLMPEDAEDLKKVFFGEEVSLDQDEINAVLEAIKKSK